MIYCYQFPDNIKTGADFYYSYVCKLLENRKDVIFFTDLPNFLENDLKNLKEDDVVINTLCFAHLFHYLREKYNLKFRIIRDCQTSLHVSYLMQEALLQDYIQDRDICLFPSEFTRSLYIHLFENLNEGNTIMCYPILKSFPKTVPKKTNEFKYGYLGRVTFAKNFDTVINFAELSKERILVAGKIEFPNEFLPPNIEYIGETNEIWDFLSRIDVLLFPSTANIESLGRVILEANHSCVKVIGANHGATPENCSNLLNVEYKSEADLTYNNPLGKVDANEIINLKSLKEENNKNFVEHEELLINIIEEKFERSKAISPNNFILKSKVLMDLTHQKIYIFEKTIQMLKSNNYFEVGPITQKIAKSINFNPKWMIKH